MSNFYYVYLPNNFVIVFYKQNIVAEMFIQMWKNIRERWFRINR